MGRMLAYAIALLGGVTLTNCLFELPDVLPNDPRANRGGGGGPGEGDDGAGGRPIAFRDQRIFTVAEAAPTIERPFAIAIVLDETRIDYSLTTPDGSDVRFLDATGEVLAHEWDQFDRAGRSIAFVSLPRLAPGQTLTMAYGGDGPPPARSPSNTWSRYDFVYHFSPDRDFDTAVESSPNALTGQMNGLTGRLAVPGEAPAALGGALRFNDRSEGAQTGDEPYINFGRSAALSVQAGEEMTLEIWYSWLGLASNTSGNLVFKEEDCAGWHITMFRIPDTDPPLALIRQSWGAPGTSCNPANYTYNQVDTGDFASDDDWHQLVANWSESGFLLYIDGIERSRQDDATTAPGTVDGSLLIGSSIGLEDTFNGLIGEMRITHQAYSAAEVVAHNLSMRDQLIDYPDGSSE